MTILTPANYFLRPDLTAKPGITYQIGNMISSPSAQIVNAVAESHFVTSALGDRVPAYGPTMGVATAIIAIGIAVTCAFGPEKRGRKFELAKAAGVGAAMDSDSDIEKSVRRASAGSPDARVSDVDIEKK